MKAAFNDNNNKIPQIQLVLGLTKIYSVQSSSLRWASPQIKSNKSELVSEHFLKCECVRIRSWLCGDNVQRGQHLPLSAGDFSFISKLKLKSFFDVLFCF